jgi:hypothetical protein
MKSELTINLLQQAVNTFKDRVLPEYKIKKWYSRKPDHREVEIFIRQQFHVYCSERFEYRRSNSSHEIEFPGLGVDLFAIPHYHPGNIIFPFRNPSQMVRGLECDVILLGYQLRRSNIKKTVRIRFHSALWFEGDYNGFRALSPDTCKKIQNAASGADILTILKNSDLPCPEKELQKLSVEYYSNPPAYKNNLSFQGRGGWHIEYNRLLAGLGRAGLTGIWDLGYAGYLPDVSTHEK